MAYIQDYLPPCPGYGWEGGIEFKTRIVDMANGRERRNADWAEGRHRYSAPFLNISKEAYLQIKKMHMVCRGQLNCFLFHDALDDSAVNEIFAVANGSQTVFQLAKVSTLDGISYIRNVYAPRAGATITDNNNPVTPTIDYERGTVTFVSPPTNNHVLRWSGTFDVWVRFAQDFMPWTLDNPNATNGQVDLIEMPPPGSES